MRTLRASLLLLTLTAAGCILTSGQFLVDFDLGNVPITSPLALVGVDVDLNDIGDYADHKDDIKDLSDLALLGEFTNHGPGEVSVEAWLTPDFTNYLSESQVRANGVRLWGPFTLEGNATVRSDWDESSALFTSEGRKALVDEVKGDGTFSIYLIGNTETYSFEIEDGHLVLVLDGGV